MDNFQSEAELKAIVENIIAGDTTAFQYVVDQYKTMAFSIALRIAKNNEDAEEVVQDAFIKAFKSLANFKWNASFSSWLYRIVYNTALTKIRKKSLSVEPIDKIKENIHLNFSENGKEWEQLKKQEREKYIKAAMNKLSLEDNIVLTLHYLNECTLSEIAEITDNGLSAIKVRLYRARKRLHKELLILLNDEADNLL